MRVDDRRGRSESGNGEGCERSAKTKEGTQGKTRQDKTRQEKKRKEKEENKRGNNGRVHDSKFKNG